MKLLSNYSTLLKLALYTETKKCEVLTIRLCCGGKLYTFLME